MPEFAEIIGPLGDGVAYRWAAPLWKKTLGRKDHEWHLHLGLKRKTWLLAFVDLIHYFEPVLGPRPETLPPDEDPDPDPEPPKPSYDELEALARNLREALTATQSDLAAANGSRRRLVDRTSSIGAQLTTLGASLVRIAEEEG